jgi:hypothetical protein
VGQREEIEWKSEMDAKEERRREPGFVCAVDARGAEKLAARSDVARCPIASFTYRMSIRRVCEIRRALWSGD